MSEYDKLMREAQELWDEAFHSNGNGRERYKLGVEMFEKAMKLRPDEYEPFYWAGSTLMNLAKLSKDKARKKYYIRALEMFKVAEKINPNNYAFSNCGRALSKLADMSEGEERKNYLRREVVQYEKIPHLHMFHRQPLKLFGTICELSVATFERKKYLERAVKCYKEVLDTRSDGCNELLDLWCFLRRG